MRPKEEYLSHVHRLEDELFLRRLLDQIDQALRQKRIEVTDFLNPHQVDLGRALMGQFMDLNYRLESGASWSERKVFSLAPDFLPLEDFQALCLLEGGWDGKFNHKDVLGACLGLGLSRKKLGDIFFQDEKFYLVAKEEVAAFILLELKAVGRKKVHLREVDSRTLERQEPDYREQIMTISSNRLDGVIAEAYHLSRAKASELIKRDLVKVNFCVEEKGSLLLKEGDLISVRRKGRFIYDGSIGETKKGRLRVRLRFLV